MGCFYKTFLVLYIFKRSRNLYYGWYIVAAGALIAGYNSFIFLYGFTNFVNPIINTFEWTFAQVSLAVSIRSIVSGVLNPFMGAIVDRYPARVLMLIGSTIIGLGYLTLSQTSNLTMFYAGYLLIGIGGSLAIQLVPVTTTARWFSRNLGKANGVNGFVIALGGIGVPLLVMAIDKYGWQNTFLYAGIGTWVLMIPLSLVYRNRPEDYGLLPDGLKQKTDEDKNLENSPPSGMTLKEVIKTRTFWLLGFGVLAQAGCGMAVIVHMMPHLLNIGMDRSFASLIIMTLGIAALVAPFPIGWAMDITNRRNVVAVALAFSGVSFLTLWFIKADSPFILILAFAILFGIGNGSFWVRSTIYRQYFGTKSFGAISGVLSIFVLLGTGAFPPLTGSVFDVIGEYRPVFLVFCALCILAALFTLLIPRNPPTIGFEN